MDNIVKRLVPKFINVADCEYNHLIHNVESQCLVSILSINADVSNLCDSFIGLNTN